MWYQGTDHYYIDAENRVWRVYEDGHAVLIPVYHKWVRDRCNRVIIPLPWGLMCLKTIESIVNVATDEFMKEESYVATGG